MRRKAVCENCRPNAIGLMPRGPGDYHCPVCATDFVVVDTRLPSLPGTVTFADPQPQPDAVNHPSHYTQHPSGIECIQITEHMSFTMGNAMKYLWRADLKNGVEDLKKAIWYIQREIAKREKA